MHVRVSGNLSFLRIFPGSDAQDGLDHVDGHRTVALAISPYIRRGSVDSTFYSQVSMIKTIELALGLPTMSLFDLIANDMRNSFQAVPDFIPYTAVEPEQSIYELNPPLKFVEGNSQEGCGGIDAHELAGAGRGSHATAKLNSVAKCQGSTRESAGGQAWLVPTLFSCEFD